MEEGFLAKLKEIIAEIERKWSSERICDKMDFFQNIVRKEEVRIFKERSRISSSFLVRNSNENSLKIHEVYLLNTKNPENFSRIIQENYEEKEKNSVKMPLKKNSWNFIDFINEKVRKVLKKAEIHVNRLEFFEKTRKFFHFTEENHRYFKEIISEILLYEDEILLSFIRKNADFFSRFRKSQYFFERFAEIRFFRALYDRKNSVFFIEITRNEIKNIFLEFMQETKSFCAIKEKERDFMEKAVFFLQI